MCQFQTVSDSSFKLKDKVRHVGNVSTYISFHLKLNGMWMKLHKVIHYPMTYSERKKHLSANSGAEIGINRNCLSGDLFQNVQQAIKRG